MPDQKLNCQCCGVLLQVPAEVQFVTCIRCYVPLAVCRDPSASYTVRLPEKEAHAAVQSEIETLRRQVQELKVSKELLALDLAWEKDWRSYTECSRSSAADRIPKYADSLLLTLLGVFLIGFSLFCFFLDRGSWEFCLMMLFGAAGAIVGAVNCYIKREQYDRAYQAYLH